EAWASGKLHAGRVLDRAAGVLHQHRSAQAVRVDVEARLPIVRDGPHPWRWWRKVPAYAVTAAAEIRRSPLWHGLELQRPVPVSVDAEGHRPLHHERSLPRIGPNNTQ